MNIKETAQQYIEFGQKLKNISEMAEKFGISLEIKEIPIVFADRVKGKSKMSKKIVREAVMMVWKLRLQYMFGKL